MADMMNVVSQFSSDKKQIYNVWKTVVSKIRTSRDDEDCETRIPIGERLAGNTRVVDLKKGVLLVETDHSGWIQYLRMYEKFIIKGLNMSLPDLKIHSLAFRLKGSDFGFSENYEKRLSDEKQKFNQKLEEQDSVLDNYNKNKEKTSENSKMSAGDKPTNESSNESSGLPQELLDKFDSIRKSIAESK